VPPLPEEVALMSTLTLRCAFTGCGRLLERDDNGSVRHAEPPPDGIAWHTVHYDLANGWRVIDLTEMAEREAGGGK
jgi:hypothetical protein